MKRWHVIGFAGFLALLFAYVGCQPQDNSGSDPTGPIDDGPPGGDVDVSEITGPDADVRSEIDTQRFAVGQLTIPNGVNLSPQSLRIVTGAAEWPVQSDNSFNATTYSSLPSIVSAVDANDNVVLLGMLVPVFDEAINVQTTAATLIYFAIGGWLLPPDEISGVVDDLLDLAVTNDVADVIATEMARDPLVIARGSAAIDEAVAAAVSKLESGEAFDAPFAKGLSRRGRVLAEGDPFLILDPLTPQGGVSLVLDQSSPQVTARNSFRRPVTLYLLQTGYDDANGEHVDLAVVEQVGEPSALPGGESLIVSRPNVQNLFATVVSQTWEPTEVGPIEIPARDGATRTYYDLVALGPSFDETDSELLNRSHYAAIRSEWEDLLIDLRIETFILKFMMPLAEPLAVGVGSNVPLGAQRPVVRTLRELIEPILDGAGVELRSRAGYIDAVGVVLERWRTNRAFRDDLTAVLIAAYGAEVGQNLNALDISANIARLARTASLRAAVISMFDHRDVGRLVADLGDSDDVAVWSAEVGAVKLSPSPARVSEDFPFVDLTATVSGSPTEPLTYEWSASAEIAEFFSALDEPAEMLTTTEASVTYSARPADVLEGDIDTVTVRVVDANGVLLGAASVKIEGTRKEDNPCPDFSIGTHNRGDEMEVNVSSNVLSAGQDVFVEVTYNFPPTSGGTRTVEAFFSAACPRCNLGCLCGTQSNIPVYVDGEPAINRFDWGALRWQVSEDDVPEIQMFCAASGQWNFRLPEGVEGGGSVTHTFQFTVADDWPGCEIDNPDCGCPTLGGVIIDGEEDNRIQAWRGYFIAIVSGNDQRYFEPFKFDTNPLYDSLAECPDEDEQ